MYIENYINNWKSIVNIQGKVNYKESDFKQKNKLVFSYILSSVNTPWEEENFRIN